MGDRPRWWLGLVFLSAAVSLVIIDVTIINVAIPAIVVDLDVSAATTQWIQEAYTLTLAALLIVVGRAADGIGRRRALVIGLALFTAASVLAATATSGPILVLARVLQGIGPIAIAGALLFVPESRHPDRGRGVDLLGVLLSVGTFFCLVFGLIEGRAVGWWHARSTEHDFVAGLSPVPFAFLAGAAGLASFVLWQRFRQRRGRDSLLDLRLFTVPTFARGNGIVFLVALGQLGLLFVLPLWLQATLGYNATQTGVLLLPIAIGAFIAAATTPLLARAWGTPWVIRFGLLAEIAGLVWLAIVASSEVTGWALVPALALYGFGVGTADAQLPSLVLADIPVERSGQASGVQSTAQELGSAMGIAAIGTVLFTSLSMELNAALENTLLDPTTRAETVSVVVESAGTAITGLEGDVKRAANDALSVATRNAALTGAGFLTFGLAATVSLRQRRDSVRQGAVHGPEVRSDDNGG